MAGAPQLLDEEVAPIATWRWLGRRAGRQQPGREQHLAPRAQLCVAQPPLLLVLALLADEVDADRAPVAHEVVEQKARRAEVLRRILEVAVEHVPSSARRRRRPPTATDSSSSSMRRVRLRFVSSSRPIRASTCARGRPPEDLLRPRACGPRRRAARSGATTALARARGAQRPVDEHHPVVVGVRRQLAAAPRAEQDDRRAIGSVDSATTLAASPRRRRSAHGRRTGGRKALGAVRRQALERARRALQSGLPQGSFEDPRHVTAAA